MSATPEINAMHR